jgi:hypothetical protein
MEYHHIGKIIYYKSTVAHPTIFRDSEYIADLPEFRFLEQNVIELPNSLAQTSADHSYLLGKFANNTP